MRDLTPLRVGDRAVDGLDDHALRGVGAAEGGRPAHEGAVDRVAVVRHVDAVVGRPDEGADDGVREEHVGRPAPRARLDDRELHVGRDADDALAVRLGGDDAGDVRPVAGVVVPRRLVAVRLAADARDAALEVDVVVQVRMARVDAGVDDADEHLRAPARDLVGVGSLDAPRVPLQRRERIALEHGRVRQPPAVPVPPPAGRGRDDASDGGDAFDVAVLVELRREAGVLGLGNDDVDLWIRGDHGAAGLLDVGACAPDAPTVLRIQDDVPLSRRLSRRSERDRRNDRKHDKSSGYTWPQVISPCWNLNPMDAEAPLQSGLYGHSARLHSLGRGRLPGRSLDPPEGGDLRSPCGRPPRRPSRASSASSRRRRAPDSSSSRRGRGCASSRRWSAGPPHTRPSRR